MNPHYQYAILERFSNADATLREVEVIEKPSPPITTTKINNIVEAAPIRPVVDAAPIRPLVETAPIRPLVNTAPIRPLVETVPIIPLVLDTREIVTSETTKAQEGLTGGGGGIFGGEDSERGGVVSQPQIVKSIFPLVVIAIGISIIIFKPIK